MQIWAHTLVQNEGRWLWYAVTSVIDHVDKVLIWDTASSDDTLKIIDSLLKKYPLKINFKQYGPVNTNNFYKARQDMLNVTKADWIIVLDGDEIWWENSIKKIVFEIKNNKKIESIVVPTVNMVGDMYHYLDTSAGRYNLLGRIGHFNMRAIKTNIPGLASYGIHGKWGWVDNTGKMIQYRNKNNIIFIDAPYVHTTFLPRSSNEYGDSSVVKRQKKLKYEVGHKTLLDYYYPEAFFKDKPEFLLSPWGVPGIAYWALAVLQTPLKKIKRRISSNSVGY